MKLQNKLDVACKETLKQNKDLLFIILNGSRARGDCREDSDWDLMLVTKRGKSYELDEKYKEAISEKTGIDSYLLQTHLWPIRKFKEGYGIGNSFIYCALKDGKILASRTKLELKVPKITKNAALDRLKIAKRLLSHTRYTGMLSHPSDLDYESIGFASMHICWAICMLENFCPVSKHTVLEESRRLFQKDEFFAIRKAYKYYAENRFYEPRFEGKGNAAGRKEILYLISSLGNIIKRILNDKRQN